MPPRALRISLIVLAGSAAAIAAEERPPILELVEDGGVLLADNRKFVFALYEDGTVLYASPRSSWTSDRYHAPVPTYFRAVLTGEEMAKLLGRLDPRELLSLKESSFSGCRPRSVRHRDGTVVGTGCATDGPRYFLVYRDGPRTSSIEIVDGLDAGPQSNREAVPAVLVRIWDLVTKFHAGGEAWSPERLLLTFLNFDESEVPRKRRTTMGCAWPPEWADEFPSDAELRAGKACRVVPALIRERARDWIMKCWGVARPRAHRFVSVRVWDLLPGEPPSSLPFVNRCKDPSGTASDARR